LVAALATFYHYPGGMRFGHIEAGLRTWNKSHPFPEEINRRLAAVVCDRHFAPTVASRDNLLREGIPTESIVVTGNTVIDALLEIAARPYEWSSGALANVPRNRRLALVTAHRRENFGEPLQNICAALSELARRFPSVHFVYPVHLNPNVQAVVRNKLAAIPNITLLPPLEYLPLVQLLKQCELVLTDSGGLQEEAPSLGKPVLVLRNVTERTEGIAAGTVKLVGTETSAIVNECARLLDDQAAYAEMAHAVNPYGDGHASERIVASLLGCE
jgi:UDP-N-acetylglucosamine 2-epimerase (non-hydrolysing)